MERNVVSLWMSDQSRPLQVYTVSLTTSNTMWPEITNCEPLMTAARVSEGRETLRYDRKKSMR